MKVRKQLASLALSLAIALSASPVMAQTANTKTTYTYDALDRLTQVTDPSSLNTTYSYDGLSNATGQVSPDTGGTNRTFDAAGNVLTRTDAKGIIATNTYDALDRLTSTSYPDSTQNVTYHYDEANSVTGCPTSYPVGRLTRIVEATVTTVYCYDARGNVIQKQQITSSNTDTTAYSLTAANRLSGIVYPSGTQVGYSRDSDGRIQSITVTPVNGSAGTTVSAVTYQPFGPISGYTLGNGQQVARTYDANYRLTDLTSPAFNLHVARDAMGDITAIGNAPGANPATETYSYDPLYRLTAITEAGGTTLESVTYNQTGDRLSKTGSGLASGTYTYNTGTHQLNAVGNNAFSVDADGNTTAMTQAGSTYGFGYSDRNRMTVAQLGGSTIANYTYNALNQRVQKVANSNTERYDYNEGSQMLGEYGQANRDYIWMDGIPVANVDMSGTTSTIAYVTADQLGTPRAIADANSNTLWQLPYQGNLWAEQSPTSNGYTYNLRFPGQYFDAESGWVNNGNRDYCPECGSYRQSDPLGVFGGQISTYAYGRNNPLSNSDPSGLQIAGTVNNDNVDWDARTQANIRLLGYLLTGTNIDQVNAPGDDSIQSVVTPLEFMAADGLTDGAGLAANGMRAALGRVRAVTGAMCPAEVASNARGLNAANFKFSQTTLNHVGSRPYMNSSLLMQEIMEATPPVADPGGIPSGLRWDSPGGFNGSNGTYELVVDPTTNTVFHFQYRGGQ